MEARGPATPGNRGDVLLRLLNHGLMGFTCPGFVKQLRCLVDRQDDVVETVGLGPCVVLVYILVVPFGQHLFPVGHLFGELFQHREQILDAGDDTALFGPTAKAHAPLEVYDDGDRTPGDALVEQAAQGDRLAASCHARKNPMPLTQVPGDLPTGTVHPQGQDKRLQIHHTVWGPQYLGGQSGGRGRSGQFDVLVIPSRRL